MTHFYPVNQAGFPWWALFEDHEPQPRQSCSGAARRSCRRREGQPSSAPCGQRRHGPNANTNSTPNPEEFLSNIAGAFLPGILEALAAANAAAPKANAEGSTSTSVPAPEQPKNADEFLSTAAAFASTYFPELFEALTGAGKKDDDKKASASQAPTPSNKAFEFKLNVSDFTPQELSVKTVDNTIFIEGKHDEKEDGQGFVTRSFTRRFVIPDKVKPENVECKLTSDGFLVISAPIIVETPVTNERSVPITVTNQVSAPVTASTSAAAATPAESTPTAESGAAPPENPKNDEVANSATGTEDADFVVVPVQTQTPADQ